MDTCEVQLPVEPESVIEPAKTTESADATKTTAVSATNSPTHERSFTPSFIHYRIALLNTLPPTTTTTPSTPTPAAASPSHNGSLDAAAEGGNKEKVPEGRVAMFKKKTERDQAVRRQEALDRQRQRRLDFTKHARQLANAIITAIPTVHTSEMDTCEVQLPVEPESVIEPAKTTESADATKTTAVSATNSPTTTTVTKPSPRKQKPPKYMNQLMIPEPLRAIPGDLATMWCAVALPGGTRCLVISSHSSTVALRVNGYPLMQPFSSLLPNGSKESEEKGKAQHTCCILDCIFHRETLTFFVLDVMTWKDYSLYDCDTDFRFFWKYTKLGETRAQSRNPSVSPYVFTILPHFQCTPEGLHSCRTDEMPFFRDKYFLYHRQGLYAFGETPTPLLCEVPKNVLAVLYSSDTPATTQINTTPLGKAIATTSAEQPSTTTNTTPIPKPTSNME
ncbi:m3G-cap-specific nuclear import receptor [Pelomyxa schiedti]|nr:m3G-cap-specific nuclear import receptor [Pelomyxa schiedti]